MAFYKLDFSTTASSLPRISQSTSRLENNALGAPRPSPGWPTHLKLFFISRSLVMMATGSVSPVAFWISGSWVLVCQRITGRPSAGSPYLGPHEDVVLLLVADGKLALRLLVVLGEGRQGLDSLALEN